MLDSRPEKSLRGQLRYVLIAWVFGAFWLWTISGAALTRFARELGMPDYGFGLMGALPHAGALFQLLTTVLMARYGHRRRLFIISGLLSRLTWVAVAMLPWILPISREHWWIAMLMMMSVAWIGHHLSAPAWLDWMADVIPQRVRGRFWGVRSLIGQPVALISILGAGYVIDKAAEVAELTETQGDPVLAVTSILLALGGLVGAVDILCFLGVKDPAPNTGRRVAVWPLVREVLADRNYRRYLALTFSFTLGVGMIGQYVWLYVFDVLQWSNAFANLMLLAVPLMLMATSYRAWGRAADAHGSKNVMVIASFMTTFGALGWLLITPESIWIGYSLTMIATIAWPGVEIANLNILLAVSRPAARRTGKKKQADAGELPAEAPPATENASARAAAYIAVNSAVVAVTGMAAGLIASQIAANFRDFHWEVPAVGVTMTYHGLLFAMSFFLRMLAVAWAFTLVEPAHGKTRDAVRYMSSNIYNNMTQAILMPTRIVGRLVRWTYRVNQSD